MSTQPSMQPPASNQTPPFVATSKAPPINPFRVHGIPPRGLTQTPSSPSFNGSFGRIFRTLRAAKFGGSDLDSLTNLMRLGAAMVSPADPADPKDGPDNEESGIPAAFTYFGQFIDHDLTFDPASSLQKQNDPDALIDFRTPRFDMDNLYGRGPDDQPYLYQADGIRFQLGTGLTGGGQLNAGAKDLVRSPFAPNRALIGDPRNDENVIVSQLQGLWHRFHNAVADANPGATFPEVQQEVRFHYQWILVHDFLPRIIKASVLDAVLPGASAGKPELSKLNLRFYTPKNDLFMPIEFSVAAYRFGHSMVRPGYRLNDDNDTLLPIFAAGAGGTSDLRGFKPMISSWAIDWRRFIDLQPLHYGVAPPPGVPENKLRLQFAYKIDTSLVEPLSNLPLTVASDPPPSLAGRNLLRGWRLGLPNGQNVAKAMGLTPLADADIKIGKFSGDSGDIKGVITDPAIGGTAFKNNCPLWTYVLAETERKNVRIETLDGSKDVFSQQLGPVGGTIVAETFLGILNSDSTSYFNLDPHWKPSMGVAAGGHFGLREMIAFVLAH